MGKRKAGGLVSAARVRQILLLVREGNEIGDQPELQPHLLGGLCGILGADVACRFEFDELLSHTPLSGSMVGYTESEGQHVAKEYATRGDTFDPMALGIRSAFDGTAPVVARTRQELMGDREWYGSSYLHDFRRAWRIDHCIYSMLRIGRGYEGMSINRGFTGRPFSEEDRELIEIFHLESAWLARAHGARPPSAGEDRRGKLPPRAREVLDWLIKGAADKDIAAHLKLSPNTVHQYVKMVLRAFEVSSRGELVAKWFEAR